MESGLFTKGDIKDLAMMIKIKNQDYLLSVRNDDVLQFIKYLLPYRVDSL